MFFLRFVNIIKYLMNRARISIKKHIFMSAQLKDASKSERISIEKSMDAKVIKASNGIFVLLEHIFSFMGITA